MNVDWYLVQFKPNSYRIAERNLQRQGFQTFLPMQKMTRRTSNKFVEELRPLFPGYFFVGCQSSDRPWRKINSTMGVSRLVSFGNQPSQVSHELVSSLQKRCDDRGELIPFENFVLGSEVTVTSGPFAQFVATVEQLDADQRVWILLDLMGQKSRVKVHASQLVA